MIKPLFTFDYFQMSSGGPKGGTQGGRASKTTPPPLHPPQLKVWICHWSLKQSNWGLKFSGHLRMNTPCIWTNILPRLGDMLLVWISDVVNI